VIQISIAVQGISHNNTVWPADAEHTVLRSSFAGSMTSASFIFGRNRLSIAKANSQDSAHDIRLFRKAQYEMAARAERKRSVRVTEVRGGEELLIQSLGMIKSNE
jgi:hypothetical protein